MYYININSQFVTILMNQKTQKVFLYISAFLLLLGLILPAYITYAIGYDIGDILEWSWGLQIILPRDLEVADVGIHYHPFIIPLLVTTTAIVLIITLFIEIRKIELKIIYLKNINLAFAIVLIILWFLYMFTRMIGIPISIYFFSISGILTIVVSTMGKREIYRISKK